MTPSDFYFAFFLDTGSDYHGIGFVSKEYWEKTHCWDDQHLSLEDKFDNFPEYLEEVMESTYAVDSEMVDKARQDLLDMGFIENLDILKAGNWHE